MRPRCPDIKVFPQDIQPGDEFRGYHYRDGNSTIDALCQVVVNEKGAPLTWGKYPIEETVEYFYRMPTWEEEQIWNGEQLDISKSPNVMNLIGIHTDLYDIGDARHEMFNAWIDCDYQDQLLELENEDFFIVGVGPAPWAPGYFNEPVAVVCEYYDNGDRFWCHAEKDWYDNMREESMELYKKAKGE